MEIEEERHEFESKDPEKDRIVKDLSIGTNEQILQQLIALNKALRDHYELSNDERFKYTLLLRYYEDIVYMNPELLSYAILFKSRYVFGQNMSYEDKKQLENFINERIIPAFGKKKENPKAEEIRKSDLTINFISYLTSLSRYWN